MSIRCRCHPRVASCVLTERVDTRNRSFRALVAAFATAGMLPLINSVGVVATNALFALIGWIGFTCVSESVLPTAMLFLSHPHMVLRAF